MAVMRDMGLNKGKIGLLLIISRTEKLKDTPFSTSTCPPPPTLISSTFQAVKVLCLFSNK